MTKHPLDLSRAQILAYRRSVGALETGCRRARAGLRRAIAVRWDT